MRSNKFTLLLSVLSLFMTHLLAQAPLIGYVVDEAGSPLMGATIAIYKQGVLVNGTATNEFGEFLIDVPEFEEVIVRYLGYQEIKISDQAIANDNWLVLKENGISLEEVVVVAYREPHVRYDRTCCCVMIHPEKSKLIVEEALFQALSFFPNPTSGFMRVTLAEESEGVIELVNTSGAILEQVFFSGTKVDIDLTPYPSGTYILRHIKNKEIYMTGKVIKID